MKGKHVPIRTCIFCGRKASKYELWRLVLDENRCPIWDERQHQPGRGAYVCPREECVRKLDTPKGKKRLSKAFRGRMARENPRLTTRLREALGGKKDHGQNENLRSG